MAKTATHALADHLARRDHSEKELRQKLARRFTATEIDEALATAHRQNWLLPPQELSEKVNRQLMEKGKGWLYRKQYLLQKGLPEPFLDRDLELDCALRVLEKNSDAIAKAPSVKRKQVAVLQNRGFDAETIGKVIHEKQ